MKTGSVNLFDTPAYSVPQAAHYVGLPSRTLQNWVTNGGLINPVQPNALSFNNLAEAHVLKAMRRFHNLSLQSIRKALAELTSLRKTPHPLLDETFETDGVNLCIRENEQVINLNQHSQREIREFVSLYLHRIERDSSGKASRLYPFIAYASEDEPRHISISPTVSFGRPVLVGTGISTAIIAGRFTARDSVAELAREYQVEPNVLEDAIRWEMLKGRAA